MAYAEIENGEIVVKTSWMEKELIRLVPGANWSDKLDGWHMKLTWGAYCVLGGVFGAQLVVGPALTEWLWSEHRERVQPCLTLRALTSLDVGNEKLRSFQRPDVSFLRVGECALLANDLGTGKTISTLQAIRECGATGAPALIICPNSVKRHWEREAKIWAPELTPYVVEGGVVTKRKTLAKAAGDPRALVIVNIEAVRLHSRLAPYGSVRLIRCAQCGGIPDDPTAPPVSPNRCEVHPRELNMLGFKTVVIDEAHRIKDPKAKQTRAVWSVCHGESVRYRFALTGTPIANHVGDLWSVMHAIAPDEFPAKTKFVDRYALMSWNSQGGLDIVGIAPQHRDELFAYLDPRMRRMLKEIVLPQLPPKQRVTRLAPMTPKQAKAYKELENELVTRLDDGTRILTTNNLTLSLRLLQLSSAYASVDEETNELTLLEPSPKVDVLEEILDELGDRQAAVCAESRKLIELAAVRLVKRGERVALITGAQNEVDRQRALDDFQSGRVRVLLFTVKAGGVGLTMTAADTIVFLQRSWSMLDNKQAEDRVHRIGSEIHDCVTIIDVVAPDTIEVDQLRRLNEKFERLEEIVRDREARVAAGLTTEDLDAVEMTVLGGDLTGHESTSVER